VDKIKPNKDKKMDWINITKFLIILAFCTIFVWDSIVMFFAKDMNATISLSIYTLSRQHPIIPFMIGTLCGHVFWPLMHN
jgi:hypothetical protein